MKKILILGKHGQVGQELPPFLQELGEIRAVGREEIDLTQPSLILETIRDIEPNLIINAAAYTAVDQAEKEKDLAWSINAIAPGIMAEIAAELGAFFIHISTDYVFDGTKRTPYKEDDLTQPMSVYGESKLAGEKAIQDQGVSHVILRTAWVYGVYGRQNFVKTMIRLGKEKEELRIVADQIGAPTWARDIGEVIGQLSKLALAEEIEEGIYHFTDRAIASWYDFTIAITEEAKKLGLPMAVKRIIPISTAEYPTLAKRPAYSVLDTRKLTNLLGSYPPDWRESLQKMLKQLAQVSL